VNAAAAELADDIGSGMRKRAATTDRLWTAGKSSGSRGGVGYFAQDHKALIEPGIKLEWLHQWDPAASTEEDSRHPGAELFPRDDAEKRTDILSGGEAARLLFCKTDAAEAEPGWCWTSRPTIWIWNRSTRSTFRCNATRDRAAGTHDEDLIDEVATRIWHFEANHEITDFKGAVREYEAVWRNVLTTSLVALVRALALRVLLRGPAMSATEVLSKILAAASRTSRKTL